MAALHHVSSLLSQRKGHARVRHAASAPRHAHPSCNVPSTNYEELPAAYTSTSQLSTSFSFDHAEYNYNGDGGPRGQIVERSSRSNSSYNYIDLNQRHHPQPQQLFTAYVDDYTNAESDYLHQLENTQSSINISQDIRDAKRIKIENPLITFAAANYPPSFDLNEELDYGLNYSHNTNFIDKYSSPTSLIESPHEPIKSLIPGELGAAQSELVQISSTNPAANPHLRAQFNDSLMQASTPSLDGSLLALTNGSLSHPNSAKTKYSSNSDDSKLCANSPSKCHCAERRKLRNKSITRVPAISDKIAEIPHDDYSWRKYGQKPIKGSPYPRGYYRCSGVKGCLAKKHVERDLDDPSMLIVTYEGEHNHSQRVHSLAL